MSAAVVSVVPTYRPPAEVVSLIDLLRQWGPVVVSDDASPCTADTVLRRVQKFEGVTVIRHDHNAGIARGLNDGLKLAQSLSSPWLFTVDQDTRLSADYLAELLTWADLTRARHPDVAVAAARYVMDGEAKISYPLQDSGDVLTTPEAIQTGSLWRVEPLTHIGGFDESFGIDGVDAAACLRLREQGLAIAVHPHLSLEHRIGSSRTVRVFGRDVMVTGHGPERRTTMLRNRLRLFPSEFRQSPIQAIRSVRRVVVNQTLGLALEGDRTAKAWGTLRALSRPRRDTLAP